MLDTRRNVKKFKYLLLIYMSTWYQKWKVSSLQVTEFKMFFGLIFYNVMKLMFYLHLFELPTHMHTVIKTL